MSDPNRARVTSLQVSDGGVPKRPVGSVQVGAGGLHGDRQEHLQYHGGPDRAVCLYSLDVMRRLNAEGHPIEPGSTGENVTIEGLDWSAVVPGVELHFDGGVRLQVSGYAQPCKQIRAAFDGGRFERILQDSHPGDSRVYARVLQGGALRVNAAVRVVSG